MGMLDQIKGSLKGAMDMLNSGQGQELISTVLAKTNMGDLQGLVTQLQQGGLGEQVKSWLGNGANLPVSAEQLQAALGNEKVKELAQQFGLPVDQVLDFLAKQLPQTVDQASPDGSIEQT